MDLVIQKNISVVPDDGRMRKKLGDGRAGEKFLKMIGPLVEEASAVAGPTVAYRIATVSNVEADRVALDGVCLESRVLAVNMAGVETACPFIGTCGRELTRWMLGKENMLERYLAGVVLDGLLATALNDLFRHIADGFVTDRFAVMTPGSLEDWPLTQQARLFGILGNVEGTVGVRLTKSLMMDPFHSISGIVFPSEKGFVSCMLCAKDRCPDRRAAYEARLFDEKYRLPGG